MKGFREDRVRKVRRRRQNHTDTDSVSLIDCSDDDSTSIRSVTHAIFILRTNIIFYFFLPRFYDMPDSD